MDRTEKILSLSNAAPPDSRIAALDVTAHRVESGGIVWRRWGQGPDLVLLHGGSGSWLHWLRVIPLLAGRFTLWVADLPGMGDSPLPDVSFFKPGEIADTDCIGPHRPGRMPLPMAGLGRYLARSIDTLGLDRFHLAGFSFGSAIAAHLAAQMGPERVIRLILCAPVGLGDAPFGRSLRLARWQDAGTEAELRAVQRDNLAALMFNDPARIDDLAIDIQIAGTARARLPRARRLPTTARALRGRGLSIGAIWGADDVLIKGQEQALRDALGALDPEAAIAVVPDCGHWVAYEQHQLFTERLFEMAYMPA
jgi:2-hydroxy-6-oxonona-2,4-dienedioate hydrolase